MDIKGRWRAFPLHPETPEEGRTLEELFAGRSYNIAEALAHMKAVADAEGLPFGTRTKTYNSRLAQELGKWAEDQGRGDAFHQAAFRAYFADGKNIAKTENLLDIVAAVSLDTLEAKRIIEQAMILPAYEYCLKCSHTFNLLDARGAISVTERTGFIGRIRNLARACAEGYLKQRKEMGYPLLNK